MGQLTPHELESLSESLANSCWGKSADDPSRITAFPPDTFGKAVLRSLSFEELKDVHKHMLNEVGFQTESFCGHYVESLKAVQEKATGTIPDAIILYINCPDSYYGEHVPNTAETMHESRTQELAEIYGQPVLTILDTIDGPPTAKHTTGRLAYPSGNEVIALRPNEDMIKASVPVKSVSFIKQSDESDLAYMGVIPIQEYLPVDSRLSPSLDSKETGRNLRDYCKSTADELRILEYQTPESSNQLARDSALLKRRSEKTSKQMLKDVLVTLAQRNDDLNGLVEERAASIPIDRNPFGHKHLTR